MIAGVERNPQPVAIVWFRSGSWQRSLAYKYDICLADGGEPAILVTVATYTDAIEAHVARGRLETEGIPATVAHEHHIWANWMLSNALGGVKVQVPAVYAEHAMDVLNRTRHGEYALPDDVSDRSSVLVAAAARSAGSERAGQSHS